MILSKIEITPYRNSFEPIVGHKPTIITLYEDRLDYFINYKYISKVELPKPDLVSGEVLVDDNFVIYDKGFMTKDSITGISVFIEDYGETEKEPNNEISYIVGIIAANQLTIRVQDKKEANRVYKELLNWKLNIKIENNNE